MEVSITAFNPVAYPVDSIHRVMLMRDYPLEAKCFRSIDAFRLERLGYVKSTALLLAYHDRQHGHSAGDLRFLPHWKHASYWLQFDIAAGALFAADYINDLDFGSVEYEPVFTDNNTALYQFKVPYSPVVLYRFYSSLRSGSADKISVQHLEQLFVSLSLSLRGAVTATSLSADFRDLIPLDASLWEVLSKYTYTDRCAFRVSHRKPWIARHTSLANLLGCIRGEIDFDSLNTAPSERHVDSFFGGKDAALANLDLSRTKLWLEHDLTCLIEETYRRYYA